ncbi:monovalent cation/H+ antiporter complex subunit F [Marinicella gelatinilytica]|uniref:monovalent cation/H+ antiporter complex subunit F n=1 Tax=Marinicella gelatinilytica TaxID=2996017 RepID=UPI0022609209|nr:monovalent cation/H+ antiporter complex subunit F [Marinicella gelatinilytica]MCX7545864.1 monovalent cation/H+ antiporter complex subunit F [Marinicella gelatinilytica]
MISATIIAVFVVMALSIMRCFMGPSLYDRILAVNVFGTKTVLLIALMGFFMGRPDFLDVALVYALINFISVIGFLRLSDSDGFSQDSDSQSQQERR